MGSLEHIRYLLDEAWTHSVIKNSDGTEVTDARKEEVLSLAVQLVKDHARLFPRRLRKVSSCNWDKQIGFLRQSIPKGVQLEIFRMLPPAQRMKSLTGDNWLQLAAHPEATNMRFLETLRNKMPAEEWFGPSYVYRQLLQRCRTLKNLEIPPLGQSSFAWAVQEKRNHDSRIFANKGQGEVAWEENSLPRGLVPLENFIIEEHLKPLTDEIDDVAFAFSQTLANITVRISGIDTEMRWIRFGRGWMDLPNLTRLEIQANFARLDLHPELLSHCPNVTCVRLSDRTYGYRCQDIVPCQAAHLAHVETLTLTGWSALTFHQATLHSASKLTKLEVTMELDGEDGCFIPPPSELKWSYGIEDDSRVGTEFQEPTAILRPRWTWDWYLPCLTDLQLTSEFAYCIHRASIWGDPTSPPAKIVVPSLLQLCLRGRWIMNDAYMLDFMTGTFPNVEDWVMDGWEDTKLRGLIALLRTRQPVSHYKNVYTSLALPSTQEVEEFAVLKESGGTGDAVGSLSDGVLL
ncbi:hypothetical protein BGZ88_001905 [Linnemannia elongata]|nr:hypothetical protein BGZ88_001905 [Linnemannia elongata]